MQQNLHEIKKAISSRKDELQREYGVCEIGVFGSYAKGEQKSTSDIDILVEFQRPIDLFTFVRLKNYLTELFGTNADLVMKSALKENIGKKILAEVIYIT
ncbi:MAG: nucleotidyltransferase family protein [Deltaproteobacteria bacterium]|nr:nucleotidyltransferase family protein [Deltaproteobacteria bacterium]